MDELRPELARFLQQASASRQSSATERRLDRGTLCVKAVEEGFVVRRDGTVDVQLYAGLCLEHDLVPPMPVASSPNPVIPRC